MAGLWPALRYDDPAFRQGATVVTGALPAGGPLPVRTQVASSAVGGSDQHRAEPAGAASVVVIADDAPWGLLALALLLLVWSLVSSGAFWLADLRGFARPTLRLTTDLSPGGPVDYEARCRLLLQNAATLWKSAEAQVFQLDQGLPLRTLLLDELKLISKRLAANPTVQAIGQGALTRGHPDEYWRTLSSGLARTVRDLQRICAVAEASRASFGDQSNDPRLPTTTEEAYFVLGANPGIDQETLQRLVRALRQCWHPDLAQNDGDRRYREARIRQINVANDLIRVVPEQTVPLRRTG